MLGQRNDITMKIFGGRGDATLEIHWRAKNVGVFGNTEKPSKIRVWLKDKRCLLGSVDYIVLEITCYNYTKYIYFSASKLFKSKITPPPVVYDPPTPNICW
jgi:predicted methyltransferase